MDDDGKRPIAAKLVVLPVGGSVPSVIEGTPRASSALQARWLCQLLGSMVFWGAMLLPLRAVAWTEAQVESVQAEVALEPSGEALVAMELRVRVRGGWLEALEVAGLDEDYVLDEESVVFADEDGQRFSPRVSPRDDGRVSLSFRRRSAPRRGRYRVALRYRTNLAGRSTRPLEGGRVHVEWTLPGWRSGLDGVSLSFVAPAGARFAAEESTRASIERNEESLPDGRVRLSWRRAHLPRTVPWTIAIDVPSEAMDPGLSQQAPVAQQEEERPVAPVPEPRDATPRPRLPQAIAIVLGLLCCLAIATFDAEATRRGATAMGVLPLPKLGRIALVLAGAIGGISFAEPVGWLASLGLMAVSALERQPASRAPALGSWVDVDDGMRRRARLARRLLPWRTPCDLTTIGGALLALGAVAVLGVVHDHDVSLGATWLGPGRAGSLPGLVLLAVPLLSGVRQQLPLSSAERLLRLEAHGERLAKQGQLRPAVHQDSQGRWQDARLRVFTESRPPGLLRVDLGLSSTGRLVGLVLTRTGSPAEGRVAAQCADVEARVGPGGRVGRVFEPEALFALVRSLGADGQGTEAES